MTDRRGWLMGVWGWIGLSPDYFIASLLNGIASAFSQSWRT
jgi:hypothetical protein